MTIEPLITFLERGGIAIWVIAGLSVLATAVALWKLWRFWQSGMWSRAAGAYVDQLIDGRPVGAAATDPVSRIAMVAKTSRDDPDLSDAQAREETERVAKAILSDARSGLRVFDLTVTIAPLLGLFGTVLGMIDAFQALQAEGNQADAATLAGGIWEALLTTAAGMAVAIPASIALTWFESVIESVQIRMEDAATRVFLAGKER